MFASASGPREEFYENQPEGAKCHHAPIAILSMESFLMGVRREAQTDFSDLGYLQSWGREERVPHGTNQNMCCFVYALCLRKAEWRELDRDLQTRWKEKKKTKLLGSKSSRHPLLLNCICLGHGNISFRGRTCQLL